MAKFQVLVLALVSVKFKFLVVVSVSVELKFLVVVLVSVGILGIGTSLPLSRFFVFFCFYPKPYFEKLNKKLYLLYRNFLNKPEVFFNAQILLSLQDLKANVEAANCTEKPFN